MRRAGVVTLVSWKNCMPRQVLLRDSWPALQELNVSNSCLDTEGMALLSRGTGSDKFELVTTTHYSCKRC